jgi:hypothetical protein
MNKEKLKDIIGWIGTFLILIAYGLQSFKFEYEIIIHILNICGSSSLGYICYIQKVWQAFFLEFCWFVIAIISLSFHIAQ